MILVSIMVVLFLLIVYAVMNSPIDITYKAIGGNSTQHVDSTNHGDLLNSLFDPTPIDSVMIDIPAGKPSIPPPELIFDDSQPKSAPDLNIKPGKFTNSVFINTLIHNYYGATHKKIYTFDHKAYPETVMQMLHKISPKLVTYSQNTMMLRAPLELNYSSANINVMSYFNIRPLLDFVRRPGPLRVVTHGEYNIHYEIYKVRRDMFATSASTSGSDTPPTDIYNFYDYGQQGHIYGVNVSGVIRRTNPSRYLADKKFEYLSRHMLAEYARGDPHLQADFIYTKSMTELKTAVITGANDVDLLMFTLGFYGDDRYCSPDRNVLKEYMHFYLLGAIEFALRNQAPGGMMIITYYDIDERLTRRMLSLLTRCYTVSLEHNNEHSVNMFKIICREFQPDQPLVDFVAKVRQEAIRAPKCAILSDIGGVDMAPVGDFFNQIATRRRRWTSMFNAVAEHLTDENTAPLFYLRRIRIQIKSAVANIETVLGPEYVSEIYRDPTIMTKLDTAIKKLIDNSPE